MSSPVAPTNSSPIPAKEDQLHLCLEAFGRAKSISNEEIAAAVATLCEKDYTADTLSFAGVERLAQLTQLAEGSIPHVIFARVDR